MHPDVAIPKHYGNLREIATDLGYCNANFQ